VEGHAGGLPAGWWRAMQTIARRVNRVRYMEQSAGGQAQLVIEASNHFDFNRHNFQTSFLWVYNAVMYTRRVLCGEGIVKTGRA